jgi:hypothetical protein
MDLSSCLRPRFEDRRLARLGFAILQVRSRARINRLGRCWSGGASRENLPLPRIGRRSADGLAIEDVRRNPNSSAKSVN